MATDTAVFEIQYPLWYDERAEWEAEAKGWLPGVVVQLADGDRYPVFFCDAVRLGQDLVAESAQGRTCIAEPGLVVVPAVNRRTIHLAVEQLVADGFFKNLRPLAASERNGS